MVHLINVCYIDVFLNFLDTMLRNIFVILLVGLGSIHGEFYEESMWFNYLAAEKKFLQSVFFNSRNPLVFFSKHSLLHYLPNNTVSVCFS